MTWEENQALWKLERLAAEVVVSSDDAETLWQGFLRVRNLNQSFPTRIRYHVRRGEALQRVFEKFKLAQRVEAGMATWRRRRAAIEKAKAA